MQWNKFLWRNVFVLKMSNHKNNAYNTILCIKERNLKPDTNAHTVPSP